MSKCIMIVEINFNGCFKTGWMALATEAIHDPSYNVKNPIGTDKVTKIRHVGTNRTTCFPISTLSIPM